MQAVYCGGFSINPTQFVISFRTIKTYSQNTQRYSFYCNSYYQLNTRIMNINRNDPRDPRIQKEDATYLPDMTPRREGGDDALAETDPDDSRADEIVIVNEQRENKMVNRPSQTAANTSEEMSSDEDVF